MSKSVGKEKYTLKFKRIEKPVIPAISFRSQYAEFQNLYIGTLNWMYSQNLVFGTIANMKTGASIIREFIQYFTTISTMLHLQFKVDYEL